MRSGQVRRSLYFVAPGRVECREEESRPPGPGEVLVQTLVSAISPGSEMLFYRGQVPDGMTVDATIESLSGAVVYPLKYGYACVGRVVALGEGVPGEWLERRVFAFHPHESHFCARSDSLLPLPEPLDPAQAALLPNAETAVNLVLDGAPLYGERVIVFGQGIVGLLVTRLLARFPLERLTVVDPLADRRALAEHLGADLSFTPAQLTAGALAGGQDESAADLVFELSGNPQALDQAVQHTGYSGRVVVGSWYGTKRASLDLGSHFHRGRIRLISSQVSTIAPHLSGRWSKPRRLDAAWRSLPDLPLDKLISHRFPLARAATAYGLIDGEPERTLQVLLDYD